MIRTLRYRNGEVVVNEDCGCPAISIEAWIDRQCLMHGSTMKGRQTAFRKLTGQKQKVPVFVDRDLILVPLDAAGDLDGCWVNWIVCKDQVPEKTSRNIRSFLRILEENSSSESHWQLDA